MIHDFQKQVRSAQFELKEQYSDDQIKHAHDIFRRIAKTALRYSVSSEPAEVLVESAKAKHGTSLAGLQGSFGAIWDMPFDFESEAEEADWFDRGWAAYDDFERQFTQFLVDGLANDKVICPARSNAPVATTGQSLSDKIRAKNADLREKVTDSTKALASEIFREMCATASNYESRNLSASDAADQAAIDRNERFELLTETLRSELVSGVCDNGRGWALDRAAERSEEVVGFFVRDIKSFLVLRIVELRTERIEQCSK